MTWLERADSATDNEHYDPSHTQVTSGLSASSPTTPPARPARLCNRAMASIKARGRPPVAAKLRRGLSDIFLTGCGPRLPISGTNN